MLCATCSVQRACESVRFLAALIIMNFFASLPAMAVSLPLQMSMHASPAVATQCGVSTEVNRLRKRAKARTIAAEKENNSETKMTSKKRKFPLITQLGIEGSFFQRCRPVAEIIIRAHLLISLRARKATKVDFLEYYYDSEEKISEICCRSYF